MSGKRKTEARRWFQQSVYDLAAARWNIEGGFYDTACFLSQQAGEKALKSFLHYLGARRSALFIHSLAEMIEQIAKHTEVLGALLEEARALDLHYIPARYPNGLPSSFPHHFYGKQMADDAVRAADKILTAVRDHYRERGEEELLKEGP